MTSSVDIPFGGMDLRSLEGARAVDNFQRDRWGGLVTRPPFLTCTVTSFPNIVGNEQVLLPIYSTGWGEPCLALGVTGSQWRAVNLSGMDVDEPVALSGSAGSTYAPISIGHSYATWLGDTYFPGGGADALKLGRASRDTVTGMLTSTVPIPHAARVVAVSPWEPRLVIAGGDRVSFSNINSAVFGADNYVDVGPGDGEKISAMVAWGNSLMVFKESRFFVFYGTSQDADGEPVFDYRTVTSPGCDPAPRGAGGAAAAGERGVYYIDPYGTMRLTTGGPSRALTPGCPSSRHRHLVFHEGRVYALRTWSLPDSRPPWASGAGPVGQAHEDGQWVYVMDEASREWTRWSGGGGVVQRLVPHGAGLFALIRSSTYTSLRWIAPEYNIDQVGETPYVVLPLENGAVGAYVTGGLDFGTPGLERRLVEAGLVLDPALEVAGDPPNATLTADAYSQSDAASPGWLGESVTGWPSLRVTGGVGSRHWLFASTANGGAARLVRLHAMVSDPTDTKYRKES